jgi:hypothetical protein
MNTPNLRENGINSFTLNILRGFLYQHSYEKQALLLPADTSFFNPAFCFLAKGANHCR